MATRRATDGDDGWGWRSLVLAGVHRRRRHHTEHVAHPSRPRRRDRQPRPAGRAGRARAPGPRLRRDPAARGPSRGRAAAAVAVLDGHAARRRTPSPPSSIASRRSTPAPPRPRRSTGRPRRSPGRQGERTDVPFPARRATWRHRRRTPEALEVLRVQPDGCRRGGAVPVDHVQPADGPGRHGRPARRARRPGDDHAGRRGALAVDRHVDPALRRRRPATACRWRPTTRSPCPPAPVGERRRARRSRRGVVLHAAGRGRRPDGRRPRGPAAAARVRRHVRPGRRPRRRAGHGHA